MYMKEDVENIEIQLLLEEIYRYYGFDFRNYAMTSLKRRIWNVIRSERLDSVSSLQEKVLRDRSCMERLLLGISVNVTSMFRDPDFFLSLRTKVLPLFHTYPFIRIWHAGCSTGEEVYSMAILLHEEGLYDRCRIYATDINEKVLRKARSGICSLNLMQGYTQLYLQAGGNRSFSEYYTAAYNSIIFRSFLRENIVFSLHNLATDRLFNKFDLILCRNVLIYFDPFLQERVHRLLYKSLNKFGVLALGQSEILKTTAYEQFYEDLDMERRIYRKIE